MAEETADIGKELDEFLDSLSAARLDGKITLDEWPKIAKEFCEVVGVAVEAIRGDADAIESVKVRVTLKANSVIDKFEDGRFVKKQMAKAAVAYVVPTVIDSALAAAQPAAAWLDEKVLPAIKHFEDGAHSLRVALGG